MSQSHLFVQLYLEKCMAQFVRSLFARLAGSKRFNTCSVANLPRNSLTQHYIVPLDPYMAFGERSDAEGALKRGSRKRHGRENEENGVNVILCNVRNAVYFLSRFAFFYVFKVCG